MATPTKRDETDEPPPDRRMRRDLTGLAHGDSYARSVFPRSVVRILSAFGVLAVGVACSAGTGTEQHDDHH